MLLTALFPRRDPGSLGRAQLLSLAGMWTLILLLVMALPMEGYTRPQWATDARSSLIRGVTAQAERLMNMDLEALENGLFAELGLDFSIPGKGGSAAVSGSAAEISGASASGGTGFRQREDPGKYGPYLLQGHIQHTQGADQLQSADVRLAVFPVVVFRVADGVKKALFLIKADVVGRYAGELLGLFDIHRLNSFQPKNKPWSYSRVKRKCCFVRKRMVSTWLVRGKRSTATAFSGK